MDDAEARDILGLGSGPLELSDLRDARNGALKAHHPDTVGRDDASVRRSTYWSARINAAYDLLKAALEPGDVPVSPSGDSSRQSFSAAARRADENLREAAQAKAAAEQRASELAERDRLASLRAADARRQAEAARQAAQTNPDGRSASGAESGRHSASQRESVAAAPLRGHAAGPLSDLWLLAGAIALVLVGGFVLLSVGNSSATASTAQSSGGDAFEAARSTAPSRKPSTPAGRQASHFFSGWRLQYDYYVAPCLNGNSVACSIDGSKAYEDGTTYVLTSVMTEAAQLLMTYEGLPWPDGERLCREEQGSLFALTAAMAVEIELAEDVALGVTAPREWSPTLQVTFEECGPDNFPDPGRLADLRSALAALRSALAAWDGAGKVTGSQAQTLSRLSVDVARRSARDYPYRDYAEWLRIRDVAWDALRASGLMAIDGLWSQEQSNRLVEETIETLSKLEDDPSLWEVPTSP